MIRILTDTTSDLSMAEAAKMLIDMVPLSVTFGTKTYREGYELSMDEFYANLISVKDTVKTSQPPPAEFLHFFQAAKIAGDTVICILLSKGLSGTYQSAHVAKAAADYDKIYIINSNNATLGMRILLSRAVQMRAEGAVAEEIVKEIEWMKGKLRLYALPATLEYVYRGGRLSKTAMLAGTMLGIIPLVELREGVLEVVGKVRGRSKLYEYTCSEMEKGQAIDYNYPVYFGYAMERKGADELRSCVMDRFSFKSGETHPIGSVLGAHAGPGTCIVVYMVK